MRVRLEGIAQSFGTHRLFQGLTLETGILFIPALVYLIWHQVDGSAAFLHSSTVVNLMLFGAGLVTVFPLLLFASAAPRIPLTTIGVLQYVNPTMQFLLGVLVYKEPFTHERLIGFGIVWTALLLYWLEGFFARRKAIAAASS